MNELEMKSEAERDAKLLFIRQRAALSYDKEALGASLSDLLTEIQQTMPLLEMTKETAGLHIGRIEDAITYLRAHVQAVSNKYRGEREKIIIEKREAYDKIGGSKSLETKLEMMKIDPAKLLKGLADL